MEDRKKDHIELVNKAQIQASEIDDRFYYEPLISAHPISDNQPITFLGKQMNAPIWISSMTGGTKLAGKINENLARACKEFGLGMGLGSCRIILDDNNHFSDFDMRKVMGDDQPFFANLGIGQVERLLASGKVQRIHDLVDRLRADGLIIHVNPLQEWVQPEGDKILKPPIETIERFLESSSYKIIVKEVGQGMGPESLSRLMQLPISAIEFAAFGGTNFAKLEMMRSKSPNRGEAFAPIASVGNDAFSMLECINKIYEQNTSVHYPEIIISGGIKTFLDGYYLISRSKLPAIYGQASAFLSKAMADYDSLHNFVEDQVNGLKLAKAYLHIKE